jgi:hypothetical protein
MVIDDCTELCRELINMTRASQELRPGDTWIDPKTRLVYGSRLASSVVE